MYMWSNSIPDVKIGQSDRTVTNAGELKLELNLSQLQHHPDARDVTLGPASYCKLSLTR